MEGGKVIKGTANLKVVEINSAGSCTSSLYYRIYRLETERRGERVVCLLTHHAYLQVLPALSSQRAKFIVNVVIQAIFDPGIEN